MLALNLIKSIQMISNVRLLGAMVSLLFISIDKVQKHHGGRLGTHRPGPAARYFEPLQWKVHGILGPVTYLKQRLRHVATVVVGLRFNCRQHESRREGKASKFGFDSIVLPHQPDCDAKVYVIVWYRDGRFKPKSEAFPQHFAPDPHFRIQSFYPKPSSPKLKTRRSGM